MKKIILISAIATSALFANPLTDAAQKIATDEATKMATTEVSKAVGTTKTESNATAKTDSNATETKEVSVQDKLIDAAAKKVAGDDAVKKEIIKEVIESAI